jgi:RimJ/RimL family protein N-acetyltransferase
MTTLFETPRLRFRQFEAEDVQVMYPWLTDAEIMRYMPTGQDYTMEQAEARIARYMAHQQQHGYSRGLMIDRATGEPIGDAGLLYLPATQEVELGYRLGKPWWGQGFATEAAIGWLKYAFDELGLDEVIAFSHPDNHASIHVIQKSGFEFLRNDTIAGMGVVVYVARKPESGESLAQSR